MADHTKVTVYVRANEVRALRAFGINDPADWVRNLTRQAIEELRRQPVPVEIPDSHFKPDFK